MWTFVSLSFSSALSPFHLFQLFEERRATHSFWPKVADEIEEEGWSQDKPWRDKWRLSWCCWRRMERKCRLEYRQRWDRTDKASQERPTSVATSKKKNQILLDKSWKKSHSQLDDWRQDFLPFKGREERDVLSDQGRKKGCLLQTGDSQSSESPTNRPVISHESREARHLLLDQSGQEKWFSSVREEEGQVLLDESW